MDTAIVSGVGPDRGMGAQLCHRFARLGLHVFVSGRTLERFGLPALQPNQRVRLQTRMGQKGPMAEHVELI